MKTILVTNDDGYESKGLLELCDSLRKFGRVICVAPTNEKSACGHGLTITSPLRIQEISKDFYKLNDGSPTDCIYLAMSLFFKDKKPDLVFSGINLGTNMGEDVAYSGTVAGAIEGAIYDIPAVAISQRLQNKRKENVNFELAKHVASDIAEKIFSKNFPLHGRKILNINVPRIPKSEFKGYKVTQLSYRIYEPCTSMHKDPRNIEYHWIGHQEFNFHDRNNFDKESPKTENDFIALQNGYVSITPIAVNTTSYCDFEHINNWL